MTFCFDFSDGKDEFRFSWEEIIGAIDDYFNMNECFSRKKSLRKNWIQIKAAFLNMDSCDFKNLKNLIQICIEFTHHTISTGKWELIDENDRKFLCLCYIIKCYLYFKENILIEALECIDNALIFCPPFKENILSGLAQFINNKMSKKYTDNIVIKSLLESYAHREMKNPLNVVENLTLVDFYSKYYTKSIPVYIKDGNKHWPAIKNQKWNFNWLYSNYKYRTIPVEIGRKYTDNSWKQKLMTIRDFIKKMNGLEPYYIAQFNLFNHFPELDNDVFVPEYCHLSGMDVKRNIWIGPKKTISPLHTDPYDNIFCQIYGYKYFLLISSNYSAKDVYADENCILSNTSDINVVDIDFEKYPNFKNIEYFESIVGPGDMLFIPKGYWHYVESLSDSFSVSNWF